VKLASQFNGASLAGSALRFDRQDLCDLFFFHHFPDESDEINPPEAEDAWRRAQRAWSK